MAYTIFIKKQAQKKLQSLAKGERMKLAEKIVRLGHDPNDPILDVKPLQGEPYYRLRIGDWRVIFDKQEAIKIITIEKIKPRGDVYK